MDFKNSIYWSIFADVWQFFKVAYPPVNDEKYWDRICDEVGKTFKKYGGSEGEELSKSLSLAVLDYLEKVYRKEQDSGTS